MIRNGLYLYESKALDGGEGGYRGVVVLRDGSILGGSSFFYLVRRSDWLPCGFLNRPTAATVEDGSSFADFKNILNG